MKNADEPPFKGAPKLGLTKREYFAGLAMQGLLPMFHRYETNEIKGRAIEALCGDAIVFADEILRQLEA